jgi:hypothetical protein
MFLVFKDIKERCDLGSSYLNCLYPLSEKDVKELENLEYKVEWVEQKYPIRIDFHRISWYK